MACNSINILVMQCFFIRFDNLENAQTVFERFRDLGRKCFMFSKQEALFVAAYCSGFKCDTLKFILKNECVSLSTALVPDFGHYCELEKVTILRMANV